MCIHPSKTSVTSQVLVPVDAPAVAEIAGRGSRERSIAAAGYAGCRQVVRKATLHSPHMPMRSATRHKSGVNSIRVQHSHAMIAARL